MTSMVFTGNAWHLILSGFIWFLGSPMEAFYWRVCARILPWLFHQKSWTLRVGPVQKVKESSLNMSFCWGSTQEKKVGWVKEWIIFKEFRIFGVPSLVLINDRSWEATPATWIQSLCWEIVELQDYVACVFFLNLHGFIRHYLSTLFWSWALKTSWSTLISEAQLARDLQLLKRWS